MTLWNLEGQFNVGAQECIFDTGDAHATLQNYFVTGIFSIWRITFSFSLLYGAQILGTWWRSGKLYCFLQQQWLKYMTVCLKSSTHSAKVYYRDSLNSIVHSTALFSQSQCYHSIQTTGICIECVTCYKHWQMSSLFQSFEFPFHTALLHFTE